MSERICTRIERGHLHCEYGIISRFAGQPGVLHPASTLGAQSTPRLSEVETCCRQLSEHSPRHAAGSTRPSQPTRSQQQRLRPPADSEGGGSAFARHKRRAASGARFHTISLHRTYRGYSDNAHECHLLLWERSQRAACRCAGAAHHSRSGSTRPSEHCYLARGAQSGVH
eukprot:scaffold5588_cov364-Prasinococcus_capsulatus_cf.AAC.4